MGERLGFDGTQRDGGDVLVISFRREGRVVRRKYRPLVQGEDGPRFWQDKGGVRCAWNEDCLRDEALFGKPLIITEGEMDAWTAVQCGFVKTVSVPDGAPPPNERKEEDDVRESQKYSWLQEILTTLLTRERCPEIILAVDGDDNGAQLLHDLGQLLGKARCKFLTYPLAKDPERRGRKRLKDLNEVLEDYGAKGVAEVIARASYLKVTGIATLSELPPPKPRKIYDIQFASYGAHYRMRMGDFAVWTGVPSCGKTTLVQDVVCRVVQRYGAKVAWGSFEQDPNTDHRRNFRRWFLEKRAADWTMEDKEKADAWIERHHVFIVPDEDEDATLEWLLEKMETAVIRYGVEIIVIDPWNELDHLRDRHETQTEYVGRAIKTLKKFAKRMGVHLIVIAHPTKVSRDKDGQYPEVTLYDISDSAHWFNKCDLGVIVHRPNKDDTKVKTAKSRFHDIIGEPGSVIMQFCRDDGHFRETERLT